MGHLENIVSSIQDIAESAEEIPRYFDEMANEIREPSIRGIQIHQTLIDELLENTLHPPDEDEEISGIISQELEGIRSPRTDERVGEEIIIALMQEIAEDIEREIQDAEDIEREVEDIEREVEDIYEEGIDLSPKNILPISGAADVGAGYYKYSMNMLGAAFELAGKGELETIEDALDNVSSNYLDDFAGIHFRILSEEIIGPPLEELLHQSFPSKQPNFEKALEMWSRGKLNKEEALEHAQSVGFRGEFDRYWEELKEKPASWDAALRLGRQGIEKPEYFKEEMKRAGYSDRMVEQFDQLYTASLETGESINRNQVKREIIQTVVTQVRRQTMRPKEAVELLEKTGAPQPFVKAADDLFPILYNLQAGAPSGKDISRWHRVGVLSDSEYTELLEQHEYSSEFVKQALQDNIIRQGPKAIRDANVWGRIGDDEAVTRLERFGLTTKEAKRFLQGEINLEEIKQERLNGKKERTSDDPSKEVSLALTDHQVDAPDPNRENLNEEYVTIKNTGETDVSMTDWRLEDEAGHTYNFPDEFILAAGKTVTVHTGTGDDTETDLYWGFTRPIWNNTGDTVFIYDDEGNEVMKKSY